MTSLLDTLEKRGLIIRMPHPQDRRKLLVDVTPEAVAVINDLIPSFHHREKTIVEAALSEPEQRRLLELLARIQYAAREHAGDPPDRSAIRVVPDRVRRQT
jgi:DNA-binding MarR family transcriptional regulator